MPASTDRNIVLMRSRILRSLLAATLIVSAPAALHAQDEGIGKKEAERNQAKKKKKGPVKKVAAKKKAKI